jgi:hypothetical protein
MSCMRKDLAVCVVLGGGAGGVGALGGDGGRYNGSGHEKPFIASMGIYVFKKGVLGESGGGCGGGRSWVWGGGGLGGRGVCVGGKGLGKDTPPWASTSSRRACWVSGVLCTREHHTRPVPCRPTACPQ